VSDKNISGSTINKESKENSARLHPQTMCPGFGATRILTRIEGLRVCLVTDKGCNYGLTYVSQFYAAKKSIVSPELMNKQLTSGSLIENVRDTLEHISKESNVKTIAVVSLCVSETIGISEEMLPKQVGNANVVLVRLPSYSVGSHPEAKDRVLATLLKRFAGSTEKKTKSLAVVGEIFPLDIMAIGEILQSIGVESVLFLPSQQIEDIVEAGNASACAILYPYYEQTASWFKEKNIPVISGAPVGANASYDWIKQIGDALELDPHQVEKVAVEEKAKIKQIFDANKLSGKVMIAGYEGNEWPIVKLLLEAGAEVPYASTSIKPSEYTRQDETLFEMLGTKVQFRKYLEDDKAAVEKYQPDLVIGTTSLNEYSKSLAIPSVYYTNIISTRPLFFSKGAQMMLMLIKGLMMQKNIHKKMKDFFTVDDV